MAGIDAYTKLMLHGNKIDGSTAKPFTFNGNAQIDTAKYKFGVSSLLLDGTGDYITSPDSTDWHLGGGGDFTIEGWFWFNSLAADTTIFSQYSDSGYKDYSFRVYTTGFVRFYAYDFGYKVDTSTATGIVTTGQWYHIAVVRNGTDFAIYVNGTKSGAGATTANTWSDSSGQFSLGYDANSSLVYNGWIGEYRISKSARYTGNFTSPTTPFTSDSDTALLLHFQGADTATTTADSSGGDESSSYSGNTDKIVTYNGNAQTDTAQSKFGGSSMLFDGTGDYLTIPDSSDWAFGTDAFTIDFWVRFSALPGDGTAWYFFSQGQDGNNVQAFRILNTSGTYSFSYFDYASGYTVGPLSWNSTGLSINTWYHIAMARSGNSWYCFQDGVQQGSTLTDTGTVSNWAAVAVVGGYWNGNTPINGWIDEFRISKGIARWTANFTPPTAEYNASPDIFGSNTQSILIG